MLLDINIIKSSNLRVVLKRPRLCQEIKIAVFRVSLLETTDSKTREETEARIGNGFTS